MRIRAISLWQPWAQWVLSGLKPIETRLHARFKSLAGERIAIHATAKWDLDAYPQAARYRDFNSLSVFKAKAGILGTVFVERAEWLNKEHSAQALIDCGYIQRFGLFLKDPEFLPTPIAIRGQQGIFWTEL